MPVIVDPRPGRSDGGYGRPLPLIEKITRVVPIALVAADLLLMQIGLVGGPALTLLYLAIAVLAWVVGKCGPFRARRTRDSNGFTLAGSILQKCASLGAPIIAAVVVNVPALTWRDGAALLAGLLGASKVLHRVGKAIDLRSALWNLAFCVAIVVAAYAVPGSPGGSRPPKFEHDVKTDVRLKIRLQRVEGDRLMPDSVGYACFAILPGTWFTARPLVPLTVASTSIASEPEVEVPFNELGYVVKAREDFRYIGAPPFAEVEVRGVFPGQARDVVITAVRR